MSQYRTKMSANGRIVIPAGCRKALNLKKGDEIVIKIMGNEARLFTLDYAMQSAQAAVKKANKSHKSLSDELIHERRKNAKNE